MMYFRTLKGRRIAFVMAIIMAFTIYGGLGVSPVAAVEQGGQDAQGRIQGELLHVGDAEYDQQDENDREHISQAAEQTELDGRQRAPHGAYDLEQAQKQQDREGDQEQQKDIPYQGGMLRSLLPVHRAPGRRPSGGRRTARIRAGPVRACLPGGPAARPRRGSVPFRSRFFMG